MKLLGQALALRDTGQQDQAIPLLERAVELDPDFAQAWARLGAIFRNTARTSADYQRSDAARTKAFALRDRVTELERYYIESAYYQFVLQDLPKATRAYELWASTYPRDAIPRNGLALVSAEFGDYEKAVTEGRTALHLDPMALYYANLARWLLYTNRLDEVQAVAADAFARKIDYVPLHLWLHAVAFLRGDAAGMQREVDWSRGKADRQFLARALDVAAVTGRMREADALLERLNGINQRDQLSEAVARERAFQAFGKGLVGDVRVALSLADSAAALPATWGWCLTAYALAGDRSRVDRLLPRYLAAPPPGVNSYDVAPIAGWVKGVLLTKFGKADEALRALEASAMYERASRYGLLPQYARGYALLAAKRPAEAAAEFQGVISLRTVAPFYLTWPLAHVGLARAYAAAGDTASSRKAYEDFFALWKDADPDVPILVEARKEYRALQ